MSEDDLQLEHVSEFQLGSELVVADARYMASAFADVHRAKLPMSHTLLIRPGTWHAFVASRKGSDPDFVLWCHESELEDESLPAFDQAASPGMLPVDGDRLVAIDAELRDAAEVQQAVVDTDPQIMPVTVANAGMASRVPRPGVYPLYTSAQPPYTVVFIVFEHD